MIRRVVIIVLAWVWTVGAVTAQCSPTRVDLRGDWGQARFNVEIADDAQEQALGLMFREELAASSGMLFVYDTPQRTSFWMKNTLIPLDMIFVGQTGLVMRIAENTRPLDETPIDGGEGVLMILEINGGLARGLGVSVGSELRHPALDAGTALWPCNSE